MAEMTCIGHKRKKSFRFTDNNDVVLKLTCEVFPLKDQNKTM